MEMKEDKFKKGNSTHFDLIVFFKKYLNKCPKIFKYLRATNLLENI